MTNVIDAESTNLLMMAKDRGSEALGEFAAPMAEHGAKPEQITEIVKDLAPARCRFAPRALGFARQCVDVQRRASATPRQTYGGLSGLGTRGGFA